MRYSQSPAFKEHISSFGPVVGLCLQELGFGPVSTNLVPKEVVTDRLVRSKKPWAVAGAAALLIGFAGNLMFAANRYSEIEPDKWSSAMSAAETTKKQSDSAISEDGAQKNTIALLQQIGNDVSGSNDRRLLWMEVMYALFDALNRPKDFDPINRPSPEEVPYDTRTELYIEKIESKHYDNIGDFLTERIIKLYTLDNKSRMAWLEENAEPAPEVAEGEEVAAEEEATAGDEEVLPTAETLVVAREGAEGNPAWVIELTGYHFHNREEYAATSGERREFVLKTLVHEFETGSVDLPVGPNGEMMNFTYKELGFHVPIIVGDGIYDADHKIANPEYIKKHGPAGGMMGGGMMGGGMMGGYGDDGGMGMGMGMGMGEGMGDPGGMYGSNPNADEDEDGIKKAFDAPKFSFTFQVVWQETPLTMRLEAKRKAAEEAAAAAAAEGDLASDMGS